MLFRTVQADSRDTVDSSQCVKLHDTGSKNFDKNTHKRCNGPVLDFLMPTDKVAFGTSPANKTSDRPKRALMNATELHQQMEYNTMYI
jgi:hypothetical protein